MVVVVVIDELMRTWRLRCDALRYDAGAARRGKGYDETGGGPWNEEPGRMTRPADWFLR